MQFVTNYRCRQCEVRLEFAWDTAQTNTSDFSSWRQPLQCWNCGHLSGVLTLSYQFRESDRPDEERQT